MTLGNTTLVDHGIHTEQSDLRAHVCVNAGIVCVFPTKLAVAHIAASNYRARAVYTWINGERFVTAKGYAVPVAKIPRIRPIKIGALIRWYKFSERDSTSTKGDKAVSVVQDMLKLGYFPLPTDSEFVTDVDIQRHGTDLIVRAAHRIEVKCDYNGGAPKNLPNVTGNLFLQIAECNPLRAT